MRAKPELQGKASFLQVGLFLSNFAAPPMLPQKQGDGSFVIALASVNPEKLMPFVDPPSDTGRFVQALVEAPAGKTLLGTGQELR